tara:strand:- start:30098 stop:31030 length:933 start_codon:yes stop_codon:yes gene_type:complete
MSSTYTTNLRLEKQGSGDNAGSWGNRLNDNVIDLVDQAVGAYTSITLTDASHTLTTNNGASDEARSAALYLHGTLTSSVDVNVPDNIEKVYIVRNNTSGSFDVTIKSTSETNGFVAPQGTTCVIFTDGVSVNPVTTPVNQTTGQPATLSATTINVPTITSAAISGSTINNTAITGGSVSGTSIVATNITAKSTVTFESVVSVSGAAIAKFVTASVSGDHQINLRQSNNFFVYTKGDVSIQTPLNITQGQSGIIYVIQDSVGSNDISFSDVWNFSGGASISLTQLASAVDGLSYFVRGVSAIDVAALKDLK